MIKCNDILKAKVKWNENYGITPFHTRHISISTTSNKRYLTVCMSSQGPGRSPVRFRLHDVIVNVANNNSISYVSMHAVVCGTAENCENLYRYAPHNGGQRSRTASRV